MDGDFPDLPKFIEVKKKHKAFLMVDECIERRAWLLAAASPNILAAIPATSILMATPARPLAAAAVVDCWDQRINRVHEEHDTRLCVRLTRSGAAAASLASLRLLQKEPERVTKLRANSDLFLQLAKEKGINTGWSGGTAVVPVITGTLLMP